MHEHPASVSFIVFRLSVIDEGFRFRFRSEAPLRITYPSSNPPLLLSPPPVPGSEGVIVPICLVRHILSPSSGIYSNRFSAFPQTRGFVQFSFQCFPKLGDLFISVFSVSPSLGICSNRFSAFPQARAFIQIGFESFPKFGHLFESVLSLCPSLGKDLNLFFRCITRQGTCR